VERIRLPEVGRVVPADGVVPWLVLDAAGVPVEPIRRFLVDFVARGNRSGSVRSYAYALHRWWRFLTAVEVAWDRATSAEVRDFVLWLRCASKPRRAPRTASAATAGRTNPVTGKRYLDDAYQPRTIRHSNAVLRSFYEYRIEAGGGPLVNPVPRDRRRGQRPHAHHDPLREFAPVGRLRYNPPVPKARPRAMPDERWVELFAALGSNRDRALLASAISTGARAGELLGIRGVDIDWGEQLMRVHRKGSGAGQWLPASPDAFVWLRLYLAEVDAVPADQPVWWTLRRRRRDGKLRHQRLNYEAMRALLRRANTALGANWSMHDLRHTCAIRMIRDKRLSLRDVQTILGHAHLTTTQTYLVQVFQDDLVRTYRAFLDQRRAVRPEAEYREPTDEEYREFHQHFELRKLELGTCGRPYGSPCRHEHACLTEMILE
jgi:integrase